MLANIEDVVDLQGISILLSEIYYNASPNDVRQLAARFFQKRDQIEVNQLASNAKSKIKIKKWITFTD